MKIALVILPHLFFISNAFAGGEVGNGGQDVALEFSTLGADVVYQLMRNFNKDAEVCNNILYSDLCTLDAGRIRNVVQMARVVSLPDLTQIDPATGRTLSYIALNFPQEQRILVSELEWHKPSFCYVKKLPLVLHEYLGLLGIEIENYRYTSVLSEWFIQNASQDKFQGCPELNSKGAGK